MQSQFVLVDYIINHPDTWRADMAAKNISVRDKGDLAIFNYGIGCDFNDPIVQQARGIIVDLSTMKVVCAGFDKFGNYFESYAPEIDWETAVIEEKIDGSIIKLYYYDNEWHWATNGCISAKDASVNGTSRTFQDVIEIASNYKDIDYNKLNKNQTYIFELVSPETQVVIRYNYAYLYHLGTRSNLTGIEFNTNIGIEQPKRYDIADADLEIVIQKAESLNKESDECKHEGFVVVDSSFNRIKIKNTRYLEFHHSLSRGRIVKTDVVRALIYEDEEQIHTIKSHPRFIVDFKFYDWQVAKFIRDVDAYIDMCRCLYLALGENRKAFALKIKGDRFASFGFKAIDHPQYDARQLIINVIHVDRIINYIADVEDFV